MMGTAAFGVFTTPRGRQAQRWIDGSDPWFTHLPAPDRSFPRAPHLADGFLATGWLGDVQLVLWITMESSEERRFGVCRACALDPCAAICRAEGLLDALRDLDWRQQPWTTPSLGEIAPDAPAAARLMPWLCSLLSSPPPRDAGVACPAGLSELADLARLAFWLSRFCPQRDDREEPSGRIAVLPRIPDAFDQGLFGGSWDLILAADGSRSAVVDTHPIEAMPTWRGVALSERTADLLPDDLARTWSARWQRPDLPLSHRLGLPLRWLDARELDDEEWRQSLERWTRGDDQTAAAAAAEVLAADADWKSRLMELALALPQLPPGVSAGRAFLAGVGVDADEIARLDAACGGRSFQ